MCTIILHDSNATVWYLLQFVAHQDPMGSISTLGHLHSGAQHVVEALDRSCENTYCSLKHCAINRALVKAVVSPMSFLCGHCHCRLNPLGDLFMEVCHVSSDPAGDRCANVGGERTLVRGGAYCRPTSPADHSPDEVPTCKMSAVNDCC